MRYRRKSKATLIGVDVGSRCVKACQLMPARGGGYEVRAAAIFPRPKVGVALEESEVRLLGDVLDRQGFVGTDLVLAVPAGSLLSEVLDLPPRSSGAPLDQLAVAEMARSTKLDPGTFEMACWDLPAGARASTSTPMMATAMRHADAHALLDLFDNNGLRVRVLDVMPWAIARACAPLAGSTDAITAMLDLGWDGSLLVLVHKGVVVYQRRLTDIGLASLHRSLSQQLGMSDEVVQYLLARGGPDRDGLELGQAQRIADMIEHYMAATATEVEASLSYTAHRYPDMQVEKLLLMGGGAAVNGWAAVMAAQLGVDAQVVCAADLASCPASLEPACHSGALVASLGLAQYSGLAA